MLYKFIQHIVFFFPIRTPTRLICPTVEDLLFVAYQRGGPKHKRLGTGVPQEFPGFEAFVIFPVGESIWNMMDLFFAEQLKQIPGYDPKWHKERVVKHLRQL